MTRLKGGIDSEPFDYKSLMGTDLPKVAVKYKRKKVHKKVREAVIKRDGLQCAYCGKNRQIKNLSLDHITPVKSGGTNDPSNLVMACYKCNEKKAHMSAVEYVNLAIDRGEHISGWLAREIIKEQEAANDSD